MADTDPVGRLLTEPDPLATEQLPPQVTSAPDAVAALVGRTFAGDVEAAGELRAVYGLAVAELADRLGVSAQAAAAGVALESHLLRIPLLRTLTDDPRSALSQWALVGLREVLGSPVPYPRSPAVDAALAARFERTVVAATVAGIDLDARIRLVLDVDAGDVDRWTAASPAAGVRTASAGPSDAPATDRHSGGLADLGRLADALAAVLRPERVAPAFHTHPVPLMGGLTYARALDNGWDVDVLTDVVRRGGGRRPASAAGARYLEGPDAPAPAALASWERGRTTPSGRSAVSRRATTRSAPLTPSRARVGLTQYVLVPTDEPLTTAAPDGSWTSFTDFGRWAAHRPGARLRVQHCVGDVDVARARARSDAASAGFGLDALADGPGLLTVDLGHDDAADLTTTRSLRAAGLPPTYPSGAYAPGVRAACRAAMDALVAAGETLVKVRPVEPHVRTGQEVLVVLPGTPLSVTARRAWREWA